MRFNRPGEMLFVTYANGVLAGIGGMTCDPAVPGALRMRRFYVAKDFRRRGIARQLVLSLLDLKGVAGRPIVVNAAAGSEAFWESLGFTSDRQHGHTHMMRAQSE
jgi:GNAT superfamily N-acetyltransferase